jgi:predicted amidohydrolase
MGTVRAAAVNFEIRPCSRWEQFEAHVTDLVCESVELGADLVVLPELISLELVQMQPNLSPKEMVPFIAEFWNDYVSLMEGLATGCGIALVGGSTFDKDRQNVSPICFPSQENQFQPKVALTQWEIEEFGCKPGEELTLCRYEDLGTLICYDSEFPEAGRALAESGVKILCVPSFTETIHGFHRVRWACQGRAVENQQYVVHAALVGSINQEPVPITYGSSAIIAPPVEPFPENPILDETAFNKEGIAIADIDVSLIDRARSTGDVRNWNDRHTKWHIRKQYANA